MCCSHHGVDEGALHSSACALKLEDAFNHSYLGGCGIHATEGCPVVRNDPCLELHLVVELLGWVDVVLKGRVELEQKVAVAPRLGITKNSDISCPHSSPWSADDKFRRHAADFEKQAL